MYILLPLFYIGVNLIYTQQYTIFRSINCLSLMILSLYNTITNYNNITDINFNIIFKEKPSFILISTYAELFLLCDFFILYNTKNLRLDLFIHHILVFFWIQLNFSCGITSFCILNEIITCAYFFTKIKHQLIFRILCITCIRYPVWIITAMSNYYIIYNTNFFILNIMLILDFYWLCICIKKLITSNRNFH